MNVTLLGAGAWGTALAVQAASRHAVVLWARDAAHAGAMATAHENARYLPGVALPPALAISADRCAALRHADGGLAVIATPMSGLREMLAAVPGGARVLWLCKGFEAGTGLLGHEVAREVRAQAACGVLSGPSFAEEVAREQPTALVAASTDEALRDAAAEVFHSDVLRIYTSSDPVGVEVGGAVKNVMAIATGLCDGLQAGLNARAETFMGLSGLGDLVLTATGELSRNRKVGMRLAQGVPLAQVLAELGHVAEGVYSAPVVLQRARSMGVEMPITQCAVAVLDGRLDAAEAMRLLMAREARSEN
jgi:glycerol-3-phosphate dehydrogenase (NAD(P)+)